MCVCEREREWPCVEPLAHATDAHPPQYWTHLHCRHAAVGEADQQQNAHHQPITWRCRTLWTLRSHLKSHARRMPWVMTHARSCRAGVKARMAERESGMTPLLDSAARVRRQGSMAMRRARWLGLLLHVVSGSAGSGGSTARSHGPALEKLLTRTPHALDAMSVLRRATRAQVRHQPFPYLVLDNALPDALYAQLEAAYPPDSSIIAADVSRPHRAVRAHLVLQLTKAQLLGGLASLETAFGSLR